MKSKTSTLWRSVLGKVLSGKRQTEIQIQSQVIDGRWRSGRRVWRCPWGGKFSEKPGQSGLFFRPIRNHKDMHLDSGLEWYWRGLTWMTVDYYCYLHLYQLIILGLSTGWRDFQDIHHLKPKLRRIEVLQGGGGVLSDDDEMTDAAHWSCRREDSCTRRAQESPFILIQARDTNSYARLP